MSPTRAVSEALAPALVSLGEPRPGELRAEVGEAALPDVADRLAERLGARLFSLFATDERTWNAVYALHQVWLLPRHRTFLRVSTRVDPTHPRFPSIAAKHPSANWFEREVMDAFGLVPEGHPNPTRVSLHDDWPEGQWALRKDFPDDRPVPRVEGAFHPFRPVT